MLRGIKIVNFVPTIPQFTPAGILPPYRGDDPSQNSLAPFATSMRELIERFGTSRTRLLFLEGLLDYRAALAGIGIASGFQWIDGSFTEDSEKTIGRAPGDIDLITFYRRPPALKIDIPGWRALVSANPALFIPTAAKLTYNCDAYTVDLDTSNPISLVDQAKYWYGLFSHKRNGVWKGMLQVPLCPPAADSAASTLIAQRRAAL